MLAGRRRAAISERLLPQNSGASRALSLTAGTASLVGGRNPFGFVPPDKATRREIEWALDEVGARELAAARSANCRAASAARM